MTQMQNGKHLLKKNICGLLRKYQGGKKIDKILPNFNIVGLKINGSVLNICMSYVKETPTECSNGNS